MKSTTEFEKFGGRLSGEIDLAVAKGKLEAEFKKENKNFSEQVDIEILVNYKGGPPISKPCNNFEEFLLVLNDF